MSELINLDLGDVQKTLFLPLWGRAIESKKPEPMLIDKMAVKIIEQVDLDFSQISQNIDDLTHIGWIRRCQICDQVVLDFTSQYPGGTIVNIGCGLDTTFERTDNGNLRWYDLDLPDVIDLRFQFMQENDRRKFIASSFLEEGWLEDIDVEGNVLFIAAGVFYYFESDDVKSFFVRLINKYPNCELIFDVSSPLGIKIANKKVVESSGLDETSHLVWGLEDKKEFLSWDDRIRIIDTYNYYRVPGIGVRNRLMGMLSDLLGIQYMVHLGLGN